MSSVSGFQGLVLSAQQLESGSAQERTPEAIGALFNKTKTFLQSDEARAVSTHDWAQLHEKLTQLAINQSASVQTHLEEIQKIAKTIVVSPIVDTAAREAVHTLVTTQHTPSMLEEYASIGAEAFWNKYNVADATDVRLKNFILGELRAGRQEGIGSLLTKLQGTNGPQWLDATTKAELLSLVTGVPLKAFMVQFKDVLTSDFNLLENCLQKLGTDAGDVLSQITDALEILNLMNGGTVSDLKQVILCIKYGAAAASPPVWIDSLLDNRWFNYVNAPYTSDTDQSAPLRGQLRKLLIDVLFKEPPKNEAAVKRLFALFIALTGNTRVNRAAFWNDIKPHVSQWASTIDQTTRDAITENFVMLISLKPLFEEQEPCDAILFPLLNLTINGKDLSTLCLESDREDLIPALIKQGMPIKSLTEWKILVAAGKDSSVLEQYPLEENKALPFLSVLIEAETPSALAFLERLRTANSSWLQAKEEELTDKACKVGFAQFLFALTGQNIAETKLRTLFLKAIQYQQKKLVAAIVAKGITCTAEMCRSIMQQDRDPYILPDFDTLFPVDSPGFKALLEEALQSNKWTAALNLLNHVHSATTKPSWLDKMQQTITSTVPSHAPAILDLDIRIGEAEKTPLMVLAGWNIPCMPTVAQLLKMDSYGRAAWKYMEPIALKNVLQHASFSLSQNDVLSLIESLYKEGGDFLSHVLFDRLAALHEPLDCLAGANKVFLFGLLASHNDETYCEKLLASPGSNAGINLHMAAQKGWKTVTKQLIEAGSSLSRTDSNGKSGWDYIKAKPEVFDAAFFASISFENPALAELITILLKEKKVTEALALLSRSATTSWIGSKENVNKWLSIAIQQKLPTVVTELKKSANIDPFYKDEEGKTLLMRAAEVQDRELVLFCIEKGMLLNARDNSGKAAWEYIEDLFGRNSEGTLVNGGIGGKEFLKTIVLEKMALGDSNVRELITGLLESRSHHELVLALVNTLAGLSTEAQPEWFKRLRDRAIMLQLAIATGDKEVAKKFIDSYEVNYSYPAFQGKTALRLAVDQGWRDEAKELIKQGESLVSRDAQQVRVLTEMIGKESWSDVVMWIRVQMPLSNRQRLDDICAMILTNGDLVSELIPRLQAPASEGGSPAWWNKAAKSQVFCALQKAIHIMGQNDWYTEAAESLLSEIDVNFADEDGNTPLMHVIKNKFTEMRDALLEREAKLYAKDSKGQSAFQMLSTEDAATVLQRSSAANLIKPDIDGMSLLAHLTEIKYHCNLSQEPFQSSFTALKIPVDKCTATATLSDMLAFAISPEYLSSSTSPSKDDQKKAVLALCGDRALAKWFSLVPYRVSAEHFHYEFPKEITHVPELPQNFNLTTLVKKTLQFADSSWPGEAEVQDDTVRRNKKEVMDKITAQIASLEATAMKDQYGKDIVPENQKQGKKMFGHIFRAFASKIDRALELKEKVNSRTISKEEQNELTAIEADVRRFVQALGVTFFHCSDRFIGDLRKYYLKYGEKEALALATRAHTAAESLATPRAPQSGVAPQTAQSSQAIGSVTTAVVQPKEVKKSEEREAVELRVNEELLQTRRDLFYSIYEQLITDQHDVATERLLQKELNVELGLHFPPLSEDDSWQLFGMKSKVAEMRDRFYEKYTPGCVAEVLEKEIEKSPELFNKVQNFIRSQTEALTQVELEVETARGNLTATISKKPKALADLEAAEKKFKAFKSAEPMRKALLERSQKEYDELSLVIASFGSTKKPEEILNKHKELEEIISKYEEVLGSEQAILRQREGARRAVENEMAIIDAYNLQVAALNEAVAAATAKAEAINAQYFTIEEERGVSQLAPRGMEVLLKELGIIEKGAKELVAAAAVEPV